MGKQIYGQNSFDEKNIDHFWSAVVEVAEEETEDQVGEAGEAAAAAGGLPGTRGSGGGGYIAKKFSGKP